MEFTITIDAECALLFDRQNRILSPTSVRYSNPVTIRFSDLHDNEELIFEDGQNLMHFCEIHECSNFCMKNGSKET